MKHRILDTVTGPFVIMQDDDGRITTSWITAEVCELIARSRESTGLLPSISRRLTRYFAGEDVDFSDIPTPSGSEFFEACWHACRKIPRGRTVSYSDLAERAGSISGAARAAGQAMRHNPLPIIIPCHRVLASGGKLHGFGGNSRAGSRELQVKRALLQLEGALSDPKTQTRRTVAVNSKRRAASSASFEPLIAKR